MTSDEILAALRGYQLTCRERVDHADRVRDELAALRARAEAAEAEAERLRFVEAECEGWIAKAGEQAAIIAEAAGRSRAVREDLAIEQAPPPDLAAAAARIVDTLTNALSTIRSARIMWVESYLREIAGPAQAPPAAAPPVRAPLAEAERDQLIRQLREVVSHDRLVGWIWGRDVVARAVAIVAAAWPPVPAAIVAFGRADVNHVELFMDEIDGVERYEQVEADNIRAWFASTDAIGWGKGGVDAP